MIAYVVKCYSSETNEVERRCYVFKLDDHASIENEPSIKINKIFDAFGQCWKYFQNSNKNTKNINRTQSETPQKKQRAILTKTKSHQVNRSKNFEFFPKVYEDLDTTTQVNSKSYYHGQIDRKSAEKVLKSPGDFLLRLPSGNPDLSNPKQKICLSVMDSSQKYHHALIVQSEIPLVRQTFDENIPFKMKDCIQFLKNPIFCEDSHNSFVLSI